jgi:hypothetical protein
MSERPKRHDGEAKPMIEESRPHIAKNNSGHDIPIADDRLNDLVFLPFERSHFWSRIRKLCGYFN